MIPNQTRLFSYSDLPIIAPWLTQEVCMSLMAAELFTPRVAQPPETDILHMTLYDLIALTSAHQLLRSGTSSDVLQGALHASSSYRHDGLSEDELGFLTTGAISGQELSSFLEINNADVTILIRFPLAREVEIEVIPNELLTPRDFTGETMTVVECRAIRDIIRANAASAERNAGKGQNDGPVLPQE